MSQYSQAYNIYPWQKKYYSTLLSNLVMKHFFVYYVQIDELPLGKVHTPEGAHQRALKYKILMNKLLNS